MHSCSITFRYQETWLFVFLDFMNPEKALQEELTVNKTITMADVVPGETFKPYQDDDQDWIDQCEREAPLSDDDLQVYEL